MSKKMIENQYVIVLWGVGCRQQMSETSQMVKRDLTVMEKWLL